jgi:hypothetical protein
MNNIKLIELLNEIGESICDKEIANMVRTNALHDGIIEPGSTETGVATIVLAHLQSKLLSHIITAISELDKTAYAKCPVCYADLIISPDGRLMG